MMTAIAPADQFPIGSRKTVLHDGAGVLVLHVAEGLFAVQSECPHAGAPLQGGYVRECVLRCPLHAWHFDLRTGRLTTTSVGPRLVRYEVGVIDGQVQLGAAIPADS